MTDRDKVTPGQLDEHEENNDRMGAGPTRDLGVPGELRQEMFENARIYGLDEQPMNVNDERAFDDGLPGSISDFSALSADNPEGSARFAEPNDDAGARSKDLAWAAPEASTVARSANGPCPTKPDGSGTSNQQE